MTQEQAEKEIVDRFLAAWDTPVALDNEAFKEPATGPWVRFSVRTFDSAQESMGPAGNRRFLRQGSIFVQIFVASDAGTVAARALAQSVLDIFEAVDFNGIRCYATTPRTIGNDGKWFQVNVETPFAFDEVR